jgi:putative endonuclease
VREGRVRESPLSSTTKGRDAERLAAEHLRAQGFTILWQNVRIGALEVDLVAKRGDLVVIAEVRARGPGAWARPLASITWEKRRRLLRAARGLWRGRLKAMPDVLRVRIDVLAVTLGEGDREAPSIEWIEGALTEQDG